MEECKFLVSYLMVHNNLDIQVQHTHLTDTAAADYATVNLIVNVLHWCFPSFDYR